MKEIGDVHMVVVDPIAALLGGVDAYRDAEVRGALQCLADLAAETGVAVLLIMHLRKADATRAIFGQAARSASRHSLGASYWSLAILRATDASSRPSSAVSLPNQSPSNF